MRDCLQRIRILRLFLGIIWEKQVLSPTQKNRIGESELALAKDFRQGSPVNTVSTSKPVKQLNKKDSEFEAVDKPHNPNLKTTGGQSSLGDNSFNNLI